MSQTAQPGAAETVSQGNGGDAGFINDPRDLGSRILTWKAKGYHVLSPAIEISNFAQGYGVNASLVLLDPNVDAGGAGLDVYFDKSTMDGKGDNRDPTEERGVSKIGLNKIAAAAGVSWVRGERVDPLTIQNLWIYRVLGVYLAYDGTPQTIPGEKEIDYRDGSAQIGEWSREAWQQIEDRNVKLKFQERTTHINGWSDRRVRQARTNGAERAETGAMERAIRTLGVKHVYTIAELRLPFVALRVCPMMDMSDPEVRRMVAQGQLGGVARLYAQHQAPPASVVRPRQLEAAVEPTRFTPPVETRVPVSAQPERQVPPADVKTGHLVDTEPEPEPESHQEPEPEPDSEARLPPGAVWIRDCRKEEIAYSARHEKFGQTFTKWRITDHNGEESVTIFQAWGRIIDQAYFKHVPVILVTTPGRPFKGRRENEIQNIKIVDGDEPKGSAEPGGMKL